MFTTTTMLTGEPVCVNHASLAALLAYLTFNNLIVVSENPATATASATVTMTDGSPLSADVLTVLKTKGSPQACFERLPHAVQDGLRTAARRLRH